MKGKRNSVLHNWNRPKYGLFCLSIKHKSCEQSYFDFWFLEGMKMLFVNKETQLFSLKKVFFPQNLLPDVFVFIFLNSKSKFKWAFSGFSAGWHLGVRLQ